MEVDFYAFLYERYVRAFTLDLTMNIELANGSEGYIPPPEQHKLGGYTTWPARTAGLEVEAEPKILEAVLRLLEEVSGKRRSEVALAHGPAAKGVLASRPLAYWRLDEMMGPWAMDATGLGHKALYEEGVAFYLEGPRSRGFSGESMNRAPHLAGGRIRAEMPGLGPVYSAELWFWSGFPADGKPVTGCLFSREEGKDGDAGDHLAIGGTQAAPGRLIFSSGGGGARDRLGGTARLHLLVQ